MSGTLYGMNTLLADLTKGELGEQAAKFLAEKEKEAPYASLVYILQAKQAEDPESRFKAAIFSPDRGKLRRMLKEEFLPYKKATSESFEISEEMVSPEPLPDTTSEVAVSEDSSVKESEEREPIQTIHPEQKIRPVAMWKISPFHIQSSEQELTAEDQSWRLHIPVNQVAPVRSTALNDYIGEKTTLGKQVAGEIKDALHASKEKDEDLVNRFLASPPSRLPRQRPDSREAGKTANQQQESLQTDQNFATETLAQLHLRQGHPEEALKIYQQLRLRYPEKSVYFDAQIEKIKQRII